MKSIRLRASRLWPTLSAAVEQLAKVEIKLILVLLCAFVLAIPLSIFFALHTGEIDVDVQVYACRPMLAGDLRTWIEEQQRGGIAATVVAASADPSRDDAATTYAQPATYHVSYVAANFALFPLAGGRMPDPFVKNCSPKSYRIVPPANSAGLNASYAAVNAIAPTLLIYASVGLLLALSLRARRENVMPGLTFRQGLLAIPYWSVPLGVLTLACALTVEWLARRWAIDIGSVRDLGSVGEFIFARPLLAFLLIVVTAPVFEELLFRRWLLDGFLRANMPVFGSIVISVNFALPHITHYAMTTAFVVAFALFFAISLVLCAVYLRTRNVLACIVVHMAHNGSALLADWWAGPS